MINPAIPMHVAEILPSQLCWIYTVCNETVFVKLVKSIVRHYKSYAGCGDVRNTVHPQDVEMSHFLPFSSFPVVSPILFSSAFIVVLFPFFFYPLSDCGLLLVQLLL